MKARPRGFSLIELMVSLAIGLIVTLAITGVLVRSEGSKRTSTSVNDINQTGAYASYVMDRAIRSAGSGYTQLWSTAFGCRINAAKSGTAILPSPNPLPAPFTGVGTSLRLAPIVIGRGLSDAGSDTLTIMAGNAGYGESPLRVLTGSVTASSLGLSNTLTFSGGDLVMLVEDGITATTPACMVQQVTAGFVGTPTLPNTLPANQSLPLSGTYANNTGTDANLTQYGLSGRAYLVAMGNASNASQFQIFGVGANSTLFSYDILQLDSAVSIPIADGVVEMRALYGVDTNLDGIMDNWVQPTTGADPVADPYSAVVLTSGTAAARASLRTIVAIKVGFILRTSLYEKDVVTPQATITLFSDLGASFTQTRTLTADEGHYRFRTVEVSVPLRNMLMPLP